MELPEKSLAGDSTGFVGGVTWNSWGSSSATATSAGNYVCQAVERYFPQHGQTIDPTASIDICTGNYEPPSA
jgi:hypothetical protein